MGHLIVSPNGEAGGGGVGHPIMAYSDLGLTGTAHHVDHRHPTLVRLFKKRFTYSPVVAE